MIRSSIDFAISEVFAFFFREFQCLERFHVALFLYDLLWAITVRCECCSLTWKLFHQLLCAFKLLANLPTSGDNLVDTIFDGMQEQSRLKRTDEPRGFTEVDNHEAVKIGDLKNSEAIEVVKSKVHKEIYQSAPVRERADDNTADVGASRWKPPLVDEDWHTVCPAIYERRRESGMGKLFSSFWR